VGSRLNRNFLPQIAILAAILLLSTAGCSSRNLGQIDETPDDREEMAGPGVFTEDDGETKLQWSTDQNQSTTTAVATGDSGLDEKAEFEQFKAWNKLKEKGADSPEYQEFLQWLDYQKFKNSQ
jgi:type IV pilus biogenesis protein CpaD/CtpE